MANSNIYGLQDQWTSVYTAYHNTSNVAASTILTHPNKFTLKDEHGEIDVLKSIREIQEMLAIIVPDDKLLEKYPALKEAYDNYKTIRLLIEDQGKNDD